jgi:hypothetical protein
MVCSPSRAPRGRQSTALRELPGSKYCPLLVLVSGVHVDQARCARRNVSCHSCQNVVCFLKAAHGVDVTPASLVTQKRLQYGESATAATNGAVERMHAGPRCRVSPLANLAIKGSCMQITGVTRSYAPPCLLSTSILHLCWSSSTYDERVNMAISMDVPSDPYERVRDSLLHLGLRQVTEEPGPDQPANFARRRARFKEHRQKIDDYRATQRAARDAAEEQVDRELRAKLAGRGISCSAQETYKAFGVPDGISQPLIGLQGTVAPCLHVLSPE